MYQREARRSRDENQTHHAPTNTPASAAPATPAWEERKHFAALDWACDHHDIAVVNIKGALVLQLRFEHTPEGWQNLRQALALFGPSLAVAVETNQGLAVEQMLDAGYAVYPVNPKSAEGWQAYAGTAPVTFPSGQIEKHLVRRACQPFLRSALHLWADRSRRKCAWAEAYCQAHRRRGQCQRKHGSPFTPDLTSKNA